MRDILKQESMALVTQTQRGPRSHSGKLAQPQVLKAGSFYVGPSRAGILGQDCEVGSMPLLWWPREGAWGGGSLLVGAPRTLLHSPVVGRAFPQALEAVGSCSVARRVWVARNLGLMGDLEPGVRRAQTREALSPGLVPLDGPGQLGRVTSSYLAEALTLWGLGQGHRAE